MVMEPVELSQIAAGVGGFVIHGEFVGDSSSSSISNAGDINSDGLDDLIIGAPSASANGRSYVVFGKTNGTAINLSQIAVGTGGFVIDGQSPGDSAGLSVSNAGDVNNDGFDDLIVGAPYASASGKSYVIFGGSSSATINLGQVAAGIGGFVIHGESNEKRIGFLVSNAGDVNNDGFGDLVVGAPSLNGRSYVIFGKNNGTAVNLAQVVGGVGGFVINHQPYIPPNDESIESSSDFSISNAGDVNNDGFDDLIIGVSSAGTNGRSYVVFGKANGTAINLNQIVNGVGGFVINSEYPDEFSNNLSGFSVSAAGDINNDGLADLIIGAPFASDKGKSYVVFGKTTGTAINLSQIVDGVGGFVINGEAGGDKSGFSVSGAGDVNNDGFDDIIVSSPYASSSSKGQAGKSYVVFGKAGGTEVELSQVANGLGGFVINGESNNDFSGMSVSSAGDVNGDGFADLLVGAVFAARGTTPGKSYVVFGDAFTPDTEIYQGSAGDDFLTASSDSQVVMGAQGDDHIIDGGYSDLTIYGGSGNDIITIYNSAFKLIDGGSGQDIIKTSTDFSLTNTPNVEMLILLDNASQGTGNALDNILQGNDSDNILSGEDGDDVLIGGGGTNTLIGGKGSDIYYVESASNVIIEATQDAIDYVYATVDFTLSNTSYVEVLSLRSNAIRGTGNALNNALSGNSEDNVLDGGDGNDALRGLDGEDTLIGGKGNDIYYLDDLSNDIIIEQVDSGIDTIRLETYFYLASFSLESLPYVEHLILDGYDDINGTGNALDNELTGNDFNNVLSGSGGNDTLQGKDGDDTLIGGAGINTLIGGAGDDIYDINSTSDTVIEEAEGGNDTIRASLGYSLSNLANVEHLVLVGNAITGTGNALANRITGNAQNNTLSGAAGNDYLNGATGTDTLDGGVGVDELAGGKDNDIYLVDTTADRIIENGGEGTDTVRTSVNFSLATLINVENLTLLNHAIQGVGNSLNNTISGNAVNNNLFGGAGNDILNGNLGNDTLSGGLNNDTYVVDSTTDTLVENTGEGTDVVQSSVNFSLAAIANIENLALTGNALNGTGNALNNTLKGNAQTNTLDGGSGNDILDGNAGTDTLLGGVGNDIYVVDSTTDTLIEKAGEGTDVVQSSVNFSIATIANLDNLVLTGNAMNGTGNSSHNTLKGNAQTNMLSGNSGNDMLEGNAGNDTLMGGTESDTLIGGLGDDTLTGHEGTDFLVLNAPSQGIDTITDFQVGQDKIRVSVAVFGGGLTPGAAITASQFLSTSGATTPTNAAQRFVYNSTIGALFYDATGNQSGSGTIQIATFTTKPALSQTDIIVIP